MARAVRVIGMFQQNPEVLVQSITITVNTAKSMGFTETPCDQCGAPCWIGPNQQREYETTPGPVAVMCYGCVLFGQNITIVTTPDVVQAPRRKP